MSHAPCEKCGRLVVDGSTDFGFGFVLRPTCEGIEVRIDGELRCYVTKDELWRFLDRAYGRPLSSGD